MTENSGETKMREIRDNNGKRIRVRIVIEDVLYKRDTEKREF